MQSTPTVVSLADIMVVEGASIPLRLGFEDIGNVSGRYWANDFVGDTYKGRVQNW